MTEIEQILYHFFKCEYKGFAEKIFLVLQPSMIDSNHHRYIYNVVQKFEKEFKRLPNIGETTVRIEEDDVLQTFKNLMDKDEIGELGQDVINSVTEEFIKRENLIHYLSKAWEASEDGKFDVVSNVINTINSKVLPFSFSETHYIKLSDIDRVRSIMIDNEELFSNGRMLQNFVQNGGTPKGTFTVYAGASHSGKSVFLMNDANNYAQLGMNVLFFTLEMKDKTIIKETYSERTGFSPNSVFRLMEDTNYKEHFQEYFPQNRGEIFIEELGEGDLSVGGVRNTINEIELKEQIKIDVVVIDYINLMKTDKKLARDERVKELIEPLRGLCKEMDLIGVSATQLTNEFDKMILANPERIWDADKSHVQEGASLYRACDYFYIILNNNLCREMNRIFLKPVKLRGTDGQFIGRRISLTFDRDTSKLLETQDECNRQLVANDKLYNEFLKKYHSNYENYGLRALEGQGISKQIELTNRKYKDSRFNAEMRKNVSNIVNEKEDTEKEVVEDVVVVEAIKVIEEVKKPKRVLKKNIYDDNIPMIQELLNNYEN